MERLLPFYDDPGVGAVGGRQIRRVPGELGEGVDSIGQLQEDGTISGISLPTRAGPVPVDHLLGANMSFRRSVLDQIGGIHEGYGGTCVREETDLCLRVAHAGYKLVFTPDAVVEHLAAPYAKGARFDLRYAYWAQKNHLIVLIRNFGVTGPIVRRYLSTSVGRPSLTSASGRRAGEGPARTTSTVPCVPPAAPSCGPAWWWRPPSPGCGPASAREDRPGPTTGLSPSGPIGRRPPALPPYGPR